MDAIPAKVSINTQVKIMFTHLPVRVLSVVANTGFATILHFLKSFFSCHVHGLWKDVPLNMIDDRIQSPVLLSPLKKIDRTKTVKTLPRPEKGQTKSQLTDRMIFLPQTFASKKLT